MLLWSVHTFDTLSFNLLVMVKCMDKTFQVRQRTSAGRTELFNFVNTMQLCLKFIS